MGITTLRSPVVYFTVVGSLCDLCYHAGCRHGHVSLQPLLAPCHHYLRTTVNIALVPLSLVLQLLPSSVRAPVCKLRTSTCRSCNAHTHTHTHTFAACSLWHRALLQLAHLQFHSNERVLELRPPICLVYFRLLAPPRGGLSLISCGGGSNVCLLSSMTL
jgi:hypothetical protein